MATTEEHGRRSDVFANLIEHVGEGVEDVRKRVEERGAAEKAGEHGHKVHAALSKVGEAVTTYPLRSSRTAASNSSCRHGFWRNRSSVPFPIASATRSSSTPPERMAVLTFG